MQSKILLLGNNDFSSKPQEHTGLVIFWTYAMIIIYLQTNVYLQIYVYNVGFHNDDDSE